MAVAEAQAPSLFGLIGRQWVAGAAVDHCAYDASGAAVAFALADGSIAIAPMEDAESTASRFRISVDSGRSTISPRAKPVPPMLAVPIGDAPVRLVPFGPSGFLAGSACGRLVRVTPTGFLLPLAGGGGPVEAIAPLADGGALVATGGSVARHAVDGAAQVLFEADGAVTALAASRDGRHVAAATATGLTVRSTTGDTGVAALSIALAGVTRLAWSPDGAHLAAALASGGLALVDCATGAVTRHADYPAPVLSLAWSRDGRRLATSGAFRVVVWPVEEGSATDGVRRSIETGRPGLVAVQTVDVRADRPLVAAGYDNGIVVVAEIGRRDELLVKGPGGGSVCALRWSRDGRHLAFGTSTGAAALVEFPPHLFK